jgi:hypothetical protein
MAELNDRPTSGQTEGGGGANFGANPGGEAAQDDRWTSDLQQHTRHKSAEMVARYVCEADKWTKNGLKGVGV